MRNAGSILRRASAPVVALTVAVLMTAGMLAGCASKQQKALDEAKKQAASTGQPQQVVSVDKDGNTITTVVQPPAQGQTQPTLVTTTAPPMPGAAKPSPKEPAVSPVAPPPPAQAAAAEPPRPTEVTIPAGTSLAIRLDQSISVKENRSGDRFSGEVVEPIRAADGNLLVPKNTRVGGVVDASHKRGHFKGASQLSLRLTSMTLNGQEWPLETRDLSQRKKGKGKRSAALIGGGAGLGMLIGGLASGGTGLLWGGLAGGGAGTAAAGLTGNRDLRIPAETVVHFKLAQDLVVRED